ncbi:alanine racemase [Nocardia callitridis]|uniref:Amino acid deaminase n=1 Tax=Nocardia callitridis TaxID=648753 RepID=A0ABP9KM28_9NOCA
MIDHDAVAALAERGIGPEHKSVPPRAWGLTIREFLDTAPLLAEFQTPVLTLDRAALESNLHAMAGWASAAGVALAPHGKTSMAPALWARQLAAGAWGITVATVWQAQVARAFGVRRILLANEVVDPVALGWVAAQAARDPEFDLVCWADSVETVETMDRHLAAAPGDHRVGVLVELGGSPGRTGARTVGQGHGVAAAIGRSRRLRLAGVGGYEGVLAHDRMASSLTTVRDYLADLARLHRELCAAGAYSEEAIVTAGGSSFPDLVVEHLGELTKEQGAQGMTTTVVLRSGAYLIHDDGFYAETSPLSTSRRWPLRSAMHGWARVVSRPEPELALLDAGKRDVPYDYDLPTPQRADGRALGAPASIAALNDQHAYLRLPHAEPTELPVGAVVRLGLSHPCTAFDKWRLIPVIDDADAPSPRVVDLVHTFF